MQTPPGRYLSELHLEVHIQGEAWAISTFGSRCHHPSFLVLADALLEEVSLALQRDQFHPIEGVACAEELRMTEGGKQPVRHKLNIPGHELIVHTDQITR